MDTETVIRPPHSPAPTPPAPSRRRRWRSVAPRPAAPLMIAPTGQTYCEDHPEPCQAIRKELGKPDR